MKVRMQFSLSSLLLLLTLPALLLAPTVGNFYYLMVVQVVIIVGSVELLARNLPARLRDASRDNCYRVNGSWSRRRAAYERRAMFKLRTDLLAVFLIVALSGNALVYLVHSYVMPLPMVAQSFAAFRPNSEAWRDEIRAQRIDDRFEAWNRSQKRESHAATSRRAQLLFGAWPLGLAGGLMWLFGSASLIHLAHVRTLAEFHSGVVIRTNQHVNLDVGRISSQL